MKLLLDIGNSRIKAGVLEHGDLQELKPFAYRPATLGEALNHHFARLKTPVAVVVSNVGGETVARTVSSRLRALWELSPVFPAVTREWQGLVNGYRDLGQMGVDRWLAMIGAWSSEHSAACVISCGTAVTIDVIGADGHHAGGLIIPGLELMQTCLIESTEGIEGEVSRDPPRALGTSTTACIAGGALYAITALIDRVAGESGTQDTVRPRILLTGGNAELIGSHITAGKTVDPALVLRGLAAVADELS